MTLFMMPTWSAPSELWLRRMLDGIIDRVSAIACYEAPVPEYRGVRVINLGTRRDEETIARGKLQLHNLLQTGQAKSVLVHYLTFALRYEDVWTAMSRSTPIFVHAHGYDLTWDLRRSDASGGGAGGGMLVPFHVPTYADDVVRLSTRCTLLANSELSAKKLRAIGVPESRVVTKYLGVPVGPYQPPSAPVRGHLDCLFLGRLVDFKGPLETLAAFERAAEMTTLGRGLTGKLTFAGEGPLGEALVEAVGRSPVRDRVTLMGAVSPEQGDELRRSHHVFVAHSQLGPQSRQEEALGVAYLEALAAGLPIISADGGSLPEIVKANVTGLLTRAGDVAAQAAAMKYLAHDPTLWAQLSKAAWQDARQRFSDAAEQNTLRSLLS